MNQIKKNDVITIGDKNYRFAVQKVNMDIKGILTPIPLIVVKDCFDTIILYTDFHLYVDRAAGFKSIQSSNEKKLYYIVQCLNYLFSYEEIKSLKEINKDMLQRFFDFYTLEENNNFYRDKITCKECVSEILSFFEEILKYNSNLKIKESDLYLTTSMLNQHNYGVKNIKRPNFNIKYVGRRSKNVYKEISADAVSLLIETAMSYCPEIALAIVIMAYSGLRIGEVCNIRQVDSCYGPGLIITEENGKFTDVIIIQDHEYKLRDDDVNVGRMKSHKNGRILKGFLPLFQYVYECHLETISNVEQCTEKPLFINRFNGKAMTAATLRKKFSKLINTHFVPVLKKSKDRKLQLEGAYIEQYGLKPHALRVFFTIYSAENRCNNPFELQALRRDSTPDSAIPYFMNKRQTLDEMDSVVDKFSEIMRGRNDSNE